MNKNLPTKNIVFNKIVLRTILLFLITSIGLSLSAQVPYLCDFDGSGGFGGGYTTYGNGSSTGNYTITTNPSTMNAASFINFTSPAAGVPQNNMMVCDGGGGGNSTNNFVWDYANNNSFNIAAGTTYIFSYYILNVNKTPANIPAKIHIWLDNGTGYTDVQTNVCPANNNWTLVTYTFTANNSWCKIALANEETSAVGNDFALDNISLKKVPPPLSLTYSAVNPTCPKGNDGFIIGYATGGTTPYTYTLNGTTTNTTGIFSGLSASTGNIISVSDAATTTATKTSLAITLTDPTNVLVVGAAKTICSGASANLSASGGSSGLYTWTASPVDATLAPNGANPVANPTQTTKYTVTTTNSAINELIYNGRFSLGDVGFGSDYEDIPLNVAKAQTVYGIQPNSQIFETTFSSCIDNSGTGGNMMVVDGATAANQKVWYQTIPVNPNTTYTFQYYLQSVSGSNYAQIETQINGSPIGTAIASSTVCTWSQNSYTWNSGAATTATIALIDKNINGAGNDFALDNFSFYTTTNCSISKDTTVTVNPIIKPVISCGTSTTSSVQFTWAAVTGATGYTISYIINGGASVNVGANGSGLSYTVNGLTSGDNVTITVLPTGAAGTCFASDTKSCTANVCPTILSPSAAQSLCVGSTPTALSVSTTFAAANAISFVYFTTQQTGSNMYTGGTALGMATPSAGVATYTPTALGTAGSLPNTANTYYVYAIANPTPAGTTCRPFQEIKVTVNSTNTITLSSAVNTDAQTVCLNTAITTISYNTTGATSATFTGLPAGVTGTWASDKITISGTPTTVTGSPFTYTITLTGGCGNITATGKITVNPTNTITLSSAVNTDAQTVCLNTAITTISYNTTGATSATFTGLPAGVTGTWASDKITISGTPTTVTGSPFTYTITLTGGCGNITATGKITVNPTNTITLSSAVNTDAQTVCLNTAITTISYNTTGATSATFTGLPAGVTGTWASDKITISGTPTTVTGSPFTYTITLTGGCGNITATGKITVNPTNTITLSSAVNTDAQTVCLNTAITTISYNTTGATSATFTGLPAGVTGTWASDKITISGTPTTVTGSPFTYTITLTGGCGNITATGKITVNPTNTITLSSAVNTDAQTVCLNTAITTISYNTTGATSATFTGLPAGVTGTWASDKITISGTPTTVTGSPFTYTITLTGGCGNITATGKITVNPTNTITLSSAVNTDAQTVCLNTAITTISYNTTGATSATFTGLPAGVTGTWASDKITISGTPTTVTGSPFTYTITLTGGCGNITATGKITVNPTNTITLSSAVNTDAQTVCLNTAITTISYNTTGATSATFTGLPAGVTGTWASDKITISGTPTTVTGSPFTYTITLTGGCGNITATGKITVNPTNTITLSSAVNTDAQTVCLNTAITTISYNTTGATSATFTGLPAGVTGTWASDKITISGTPTTVTGSPFTYTITLTGGCGNITATGKITVNPTNTITLSSAVNTDAQTVCLNTAITTISYNTTGATSATFTGLPAGVTGTWASDKITISGTPTTVTGSPFTYTITLTGGCGNITATGKITVNPTNTITLSSAVNTDAQTVCLNTAITTISYNTTGATSATFTGLPAGVTGTWASDKITISGTPTTVTGSPFTYTITLTGGCGNITATGKITVNPTNTITLSSAVNTDAQTVCLNTAITTISYNTTGATSATFTGLPAGVTGTWASDKITISGTPTTVTGSPFTYTITLTGGCGNITATGKITVKSLPTATVSGNATICNNGTSNATISIALTGTSPWSVTYSDGKTSVTIPSITTSPYTFKTSTAGTYAVTSVSDINCTGTASGNAKIIVNDTLSIGTETATCESNATQYRVSFTVTKGTAPYTITGTGTPGAWVGNTWTSDVISSSTNYSISVQDKNACNTITKSGNAPTCTCPAKAVISGTTSICSGTSATISVALSGTAPWSLTYSNGTASTTKTNIATSPYTFTTNAAETFTLTSVSDKNCTVAASGSATITVKDLLAIGNETATCESNNTQYKVSFTVTKGTAPYVATGTGAPGVWVGNSWTSDVIAIGTNYDINIQDANKCNTIPKKGTAPNCSCPARAAISASVTTICTGGSTDLTVDLKGTAPWSITYTDGTTPLTINNIATTPYKITVTKAGSYSITTIKDANCTGTASGNPVIIVYDNLALSAATTSCESNATQYRVSFSATAGTAPYTVTGTGAPGTWVGNSWTSDVIATSTNYNINIQDKYACNPLVVKGSAPNCACPAKATITGTASICVGSSTLLTVALEGKSPWSITYTDGTTPVTKTGITSSPYQFSVSAAATYTLTNVSDANCTGSVSGSAIVSNIAAPTATISGSGSVCPNGSSTISFSGTPNATVTYTINGGVNNTLVLDASGKNSLSTGAITSTTIYTLVSVATAGTPSCTQAVTGNATITINTTPSPPTVTSPLNYCQNFNAPSLTANGTNLLWYTSASGGVGSVTAPTPSTSTANSTTYYVSQTQNCGESPRVAIVVNTNVLPVVNAGADLEIISGQSIKLSGVASGSPFSSIVWTPSVNITGANTLTPTVSPTSTQSYILTVTTSNNCVSTDVVKVSVIKDIIVPNVFSPNGDGVNDTWKITNIEYYPNCSVDVFNRYGQFIFHSFGYTTQWDGKYLSQFVPDGAYYWIIKLKPESKPLSGSVSVIR